MLSEVRRGYVLEARFRRSPSARHDPGPGDWWPIGRLVAFRPGTDIVAANAIPGDRPLHRRFLGDLAEISPSVPCSRDGLPEVLSRGRHARPGLHLSDGNLLV